jgi:ankyrin repeat protein
MTSEYKDKYGRNELLIAALNGDLDKFKKLFAEDPNALTIVDNNKDTALHLAAMKGHVSIIKFLLEQGANIDAKDKFGATPLHLAAITAQAPAVKYLLDPNENK